MDTDEPDTDPDIVWTKPTWSEAAEAKDPPPMPPPPPAPGLPTPVAPPPKTDTTRLVLILAVTAAILLCACLGVATAATFVGREVYGNLRSPDAVGLNEPVRAGDLEFQVHELTCGRPELQDRAGTLTATGQFCLVDLTVRNVGDQPATFSDRIQRAFGPDGDEYAADSAAGVLANSDQQIFLNTINPGNEVTGVAVFDIPPDATIEHLELRSTPSGGGALVKTN